MDADGSDEALATRAQHDRHAFTPLYRRYVTPVHRYCYRRLGDRTAAEDATSVIFTKALDALPRFRDGSFRGWLFTIAHHVVVDTLRARRPGVPLDAAGSIVDVAPLPEEIALTSEARQSVRALLSHLTPRQREVIELRLAGLTGPEIAQALGLGQSAVDVAQFRAMRRLRGLLIEEGWKKERSPGG